MPVRVDQEPQDDGTGSFVRSADLVSIGVVYDAVIATTDLRRRDDLSRLRVQDSKHGILSPGTSRKCACWRSQTLTPVGSSQPWSLPFGGHLALLSIDPCHRVSITLRHEKIALAVRSKPTRQIPQLCRGGSRSLRSSRQGCRP